MFAEAYAVSWRHTRRICVYHLVKTGVYFTLCDTKYGKLIVNKIGRFLSAFFRRFFCNRRQHIEHQD